MKPSIIVYAALAFFIIVGYNVLLIQRDSKLFENRQTLKERYCAALSPSKFHPDCNVE